MDERLNALGQVWPGIEDRYYDAYLFHWLFVGLVGLVELVGLVGLVIVSSQRFLQTAGLGAGG